MIRFANEKDNEELLELCVKSQPLKEKRFLEYYFKNEYHKANVLISELDHLLVSQMHCREHDLYMNQKKLRVSYLYAIATHYDYRQRGIMRDLMGMMLEDCEKNYLLTLIEANNPKIFERYGFDVISYRNRHVVYAKDLMPYTAKRVNTDFDLQELVSIYHEFAKRFDCYYARDIAYYEHYIARIEAEGGNICVYRNNEGKIEGYALYYELDDAIEVKEIIYLDKRSLCALLKYSIGYNPFVSVEVSSAEHLEKIFRLSVPRQFTCVMARINHIKLFNKLFNCSIKKAKELDKVCNKPILLNEKY